MAEENIINSGFDPEEYPEYDNKYESVKMVINYLKSNVGLLGPLSRRQLGLYNDCIDMMMRCPPEFTLEKIKPIYDFTRSALHCLCRSEVKCHEYGIALNSFETILVSTIDREHQTQIDQHCAANCAYEIVACWEHNEHFCDRSKPYYDKTVAFGLMNPDYSWNFDNEVLKKYMIAFWVKLFAQKFNFGEQWVWAERVWGLKDLGDLARNKEKYDYFSISLIEYIFKY